jgi:hypothetical protein
MPFGSTLVISRSRTSVCSKGRPGSGCGSKIGESFAFDEGLNRAGASFRSPSAGGWDKQSLSIRHRMKGHVPIKVKHVKEKGKSLNGNGAMDTVHGGVCMLTRDQNKTKTNGEKNRIHDK